MRRLLPLLLLLALASSLPLSAQSHTFCASDSNCTYTGNNTFTGTNTFTGPTTFTSPLVAPLCSYTVSTLPTNFPTNTVCLATDANPTCIVGGGSITPAICRWNGSIWTTLVPGGGGGAGVYLPLTGGTLTGGLSGTSAVFSGNVAAGTEVIRHCRHGRERP